MENNGLARFQFADCIRVFNHVIKIIVPASDCRNTGSIAINISPVEFRIFSFGCSFFRHLTEIYGSDRIQNPTCVCGSLNRCFTAHFHLPESRNRFLLFFRRSFSRRFLYIRRFRHRSLCFRRFISFLNDGIIRHFTGSLTVSSFVNDGFIVFPFAGQHSPGLPRCLKGHQKRQRGRQILLRLHMFPFLALLKRSILRCCVSIRYSVTTYGTYPKTISYKFTEKKNGMLLQ